tara:strand:+ start:60 stop:200 length:141 start_codon:yes stop_codon:yes gene_type:complete
MKIKILFLMLVILLASCSSRSSFPIGMHECGTPVPNSYTNTCWWRS